MRKKMAYCASMHARANRLVFQEGIERKMDDGLFIVISGKLILRVDRGRDDF
jgi:hypothetical protein